MGEGDFIYYVINFSPSLTPLLPLDRPHTHSQSLTSPIAKVCLLSLFSDLSPLVPPNSSPDDAHFLNKPDHQDAHFSY